MATAPRENNNTEPALLHDGNLSPKPFDSSLFSSLLYLPQSSQSGGSCDFFLDVTVSPLFVESRKTAGSLQFSSASYPKTFFATVDMTDIPMPPETGLQESKEVGEGHSSPDPSPAEPHNTSATNVQEDQQSTAATTNTEDYHSAQEDRESQESPIPEGPATNKEDDASLNAESSSQTPLSSAATTTTATTAENRSTTDKGTQTPRSSSKKHGSKSRTTRSRSTSGAAGHKTSGRSPTNPGLYTAPQSARPQRDLLALHRESCRLFGSFGTTDNATGVDGIQDPAMASGALILDEEESTADTLGISASLTSNEHPESPAAPTRAKSYGPSFLNDEEDVEEADKNPQLKAFPPTAIDWTLPSTRKREYQKIDRSYRGVRGMWHKFAPRAFQGQQRMPFYVEGTEGTKHEGSVRRFRMDVPDDAEEAESEEHNSSISKGGRDWIENKAVGKRDKTDKTKSRRHWPITWRRKTG